MCSGRAGDLLGRCSGGARSCSRSGAVGDELLAPPPPTSPTAHLPPSASRPARAVVVSPNPDYPGVTLVGNLNYKTLIHRA